MNKKLSPAAKFRRRLAAMHKKTHTTPGCRTRKQPKEQFFEHDIRFNADNSPPQDDLVDPPDSSTNPEPELGHVAEEESGQNSHGASSVSDYERGDPYPDRRIKSAVHRNDSLTNPGNPGVVPRLRNSSSFLRKSRRPNGLPSKQHPRKTIGPSWNNRRLLLKLQQQLRLQGLCISSLVTMPTSSSGTDPKRATADTGVAASGCRHCHCACAISNPPVSATGERLTVGHKHTATCNDGDGWSQFNDNPRRCNIQPRPRGYHSEHPELNSPARASRSSSCDSIASSLAKESAALCQLREQYRSACSHSPAESSWQNRNLHLANRHHQPYHHRHTHNHQHKLCIKTTTAAAAASTTSGRAKSPALSPICMQAMHSIVSVRETHHIAQAQQEKNAKLRDAFGISQYFVEGTSFDQDRKAKEDLAKSEALQKELAEKEKAKELERANRKRYALVRTPSPEKERDQSADRNGAGKRGRDNGEDGDDDDDEGGHDTDGKITSKASRGKDEKKKKKKKARDTSSSPERKKEKKKKSKKNKKERSKKKHSKKAQHGDDSDSSDSDSDSSSDSDGSSDSERESSSKRKKKSSKKDKKKKSSKKKKALSRSSSRNKSPVAQKKQQKEERAKRDIRDEKDHHDIPQVSRDRSRKNNDRDRDRDRAERSVSRERENTHRDVQRNDRYDISHRGYGGSFPQGSRDHSNAGKEVQNRYSQRDDKPRYDERERRSRSRNRRRERSMERERKYKSRSRSGSRRRDRTPTADVRSPERSRERQRRNRTPNRRDGKEQQFDRSQRERDVDRGYDRERNQNRSEREAERLRIRENVRDRNRNDNEQPERSKQRSPQAASGRRNTNSPSRRHVRRNESPIKKRSITPQPRSSKSEIQAGASERKNRSKSPVSKRGLQDKERESNNQKRMSVSPSKSRSTRNVEQAERPTTKTDSSDDSDASDLSYSPARRDPDRYHDILQRQAASYGNGRNHEATKPSREEIRKQPARSVSREATRESDRSVSPPNRAKPVTKQTKRTAVRNESDRSSRSRSRSRSRSTKQRTNSSASPAKKMESLRRRASPDATKVSDKLSAVVQDPSPRRSSSKSKATEESAPKMGQSSRRAPSRSPDSKRRRTERDVGQSREAPAHKTVRSDRNEADNTKANKDAESRRHKSRSPERRGHDAPSTMVTSVPVAVDSESKRSKSKKSSTSSASTSATAIIQQPVVKLHSPESSHSSARSNGEESDTDRTKDDDRDNLDAFLPTYDENREQEKDLSLLKALKHDLAAKAKQSLEKKKSVSESATGSSSVKVSQTTGQKSGDLAATAPIVEVRVGESRERELLQTKQPQLQLATVSFGNTTMDPGVSLQQAKPKPSVASERELKTSSSSQIKKEIHDIISTVGACAVADGSEGTASSLSKTSILHAVDSILKEKISGKAASSVSSSTTKRRSKARGSRSKSRSRSRSRSHKSRSYSSSSSDTGSSRSRSRSSSSHSASSSEHASSRSRSRSSSHSSHSTAGRSRTGSRSPSIPRRAGSPSFLDRRRITSARKRPIPYRRPSPSSMSSGSSYHSRESRSRSRSRSKS